jgi:S1-C subfamily serine protease
VVGLACWVVVAAAQAASADIDPVELEAKTRALAQASAAVVGVRVTAVDNARSADTLGRQRRGSGVVIDREGLVLTIGYLILEADHVDLVFGDQRTMPARVVAYDLASGFGLLRPLVPVQVEPARLGSSTGVSRDMPLMIASGGRDGDLSLARMIDQRAFSGYWEYHIDGAMFTAPARSDHSGASLFNADGELLGIGSLIVADAAGPGQPRLAGNMFVPIDLLKPILAELRERGASRSSTRAWLGLNCVEEAVTQDGRVRVVRVAPDSPAETAGLRVGDRIVRIDDTPVRGLASFYKALWSNESPEREVHLEILRGDAAQDVTVLTQDRMKTLSKPRGI